VAVCRCGVRPRGLLLEAARSEAGRGLAGDHDGVVVAVVPGEDASAVAAELARRLGDGGPPVTVGAAGPVVPARGLRESYERARRTADAMLALGMTGRGGSVRELGFAGLIDGPRGDVDGYVTGVLGPLLDYDTRRGTRLVETVETYFAAGGSPTRAAAELHVHVNTVAQRLERVAALLGADWQTPDRGLDVQIALRLHRLRDGRADRLD
jgi:DNA-binding PucR family transcriptional regulator